MQNEKQKQRFPKWGYGIIVGVVCIVVIGLLIGISIKLLKVKIGGEEQSAIILTQTVTPIPTIETSMTTPAPTESTAFTLTPELLLGTGSTMVNDIDSADLVYVPAGEFIMGSESDLAFNNEAPEHIVYLDAYWIYVYEVTNAQYRSCIAENICQGNLNDYSENNLPVVNVTWYEADLYCTAMGGRLPSEAEWEKAARGIDDRLYPWGNSSPTCDLAYIEKCGPGKIPVGSLPEGMSPFGVMDMAGNAWEWTADWYEFEYYIHSTDNNPTGPTSGDNRVVRGVTWYPFHRSMRVSYRWSYHPENSYDTIGFRCVIDP